MDTFIKENNSETSIVGEPMGKVLIASLYSSDAVLLAAHRLSPDRLFLFISDQPDKTVDESLKVINASLGRIIPVKTVKVKVYDIVHIASEVVKLIDAQPKNEEIYVNITSGRKTLAIGMLLACYTRGDSVKKIAYNPEEDKGSVVYLPKLSFNLNKSQTTLLEHLAHAKTKSTTELAEETEISRAMLYKIIKELKDMDLVEVTDDGVILTDAGKIARM